MGFSDILSSTRKIDWKFGWQADRENAVWLQRRDGCDRHAEVWRRCEDKDEESVSGTEEVCILGRRKFKSL